MSGGRTLCQACGDHVARPFPTIIQRWCRPCAGLAHAWQAERGACVDCGAALEHRRVAGAIQLWLCPACVTPAWVPALTGYCIPCRGRGELHDPGCPGEGACNRIYMAAIPTPEGERLPKRGIDRLVEMLVAVRDEPVPACSRPCCQACEGTGLRDGIRHRPDLALDTAA